MSKSVSMKLKARADLSYVLANGSKAIRETVLVFLAKARRAVLKEKKSKAGA